MIDYIMNKINELTYHWKSDEEIFNIIVKYISKSKKFQKIRNKIKDKNVPEEDFRIQITPSGQIKCRKNKVKRDKNDYCMILSAPNYPKFHDNTININLHTHPKKCINKYLRKQGYKKQLKTYCLPSHIDLSNTLDMAIKYKTHNTLFCILSSNDISMHVINKDLYNELIKNEEKIKDVILTNGNKLVTDDKVKIENLKEKYKYLLGTENIKAIDFYYHRF